MKKNNGKNVKISEAEWLLNQEPNQKPQNIKEYNLEILCKGKKINDK